MRLEEAEKMASAAINLYDKMVETFDSTDEKVLLKAILMGLAMDCYRKGFGDCLSEADLTEKEKIKPTE